MSAILYNIQARQREHDLAYGSFDQFTVDAGTKTSPQMVIDERVWHPYCVDDAREQVIFTEIPPTVDLTEKAFAFQYQFTEATRLLAIPYDELMSLADQAQLPEKLIFIFSTGRCGSTLLNQIMNEMDGVNSLSEPDVPTNITALRINNHTKDAVYIDVLDACTRLQVHALMTDNIHAFGLKFRGQAIELLDLYYQRFPTARYLFMYRNALEWAKSMYRFMRLLGAPDSFGRDILYMASGLSGYSIGDKLGTHLDLGRERFYLSEIFACLWLHMMDVYLLALANGVPFFPLTYEDLTGKRETTISHLLEFCGISANLSAQAMQGYNLDSQRGTVLERDFESERINDEQLAHFMKILQAHPYVKTADFRLPDKPLA